MYYLVLISTYWNVKLSIAQEYEQATDVLISTYWNVKEETATEESRSGGFNLNLLECKAIYRVCMQYVQSVLISTYWNVNK